MNSSEDMPPDMEILTTSKAMGLLLAVSLLLASCGDDPAPKPTVPAGAKVAPEQLAEAKKHGVPVAFENDLGMRFVLIPAGTFLMGSPEEDRRRRETQHEVTLSRPFFMSIYEVTNGQYRAHVPEHVSEDVEGLSIDADNQSVVRVSWFDAVAYAERLGSSLQGRTYRLPTEAEWGDACRAGTTTHFWMGDLSTPDEHEDVWPRALVTEPVGTYAPNPWGLHDMHSNVAEWCHDWRGLHPREPVADPPGPAYDMWKVLRSGDFSTFPPWGRSAERGFWRPGARLITLGFRLVADLPEPGEGER